MTTSPTTTHSDAVTAGRAPTRARALAVLSSTAAALAVWVLAGPVLGIDLQVQLQPGQVETVGPTTVLVTGLLAALAGWAVLAVLERLTGRARTIWTVIALLALTGSLGGPLTGGITVGTKVALALMHLAVAAFLIPTLRRTSSTR